MCKFFKTQVLRDRQKCMIQRVRYIEVRLQMYLPILVQQFKFPTNDSLEKYSPVSFLSQSGPADRTFFI